MNRKRDRNGVIQRINCGFCVYQFLKAARKNGETRRAAMSEDDEDDSSSSSSSEDDEDDEDEDTVRRKHFWRQVDDDRYLYLAIFLHRKYTIQPL